MKIGAYNIKKVNASLLPLSIVRSVTGLNAATAKKAGVVLSAKKNNVIMSAPAFIF